MKNVFRGMLMGITDLIPGVSGGTVAMILGIYHELLASINGILSKDWRKHLVFLAPLLVGIGAAVLIFSRIVEWLIVFHPQPLFFFFNGLILGIIPFLLRSANYKQTFKISHYVLFVFAALLVASSAFISSDKQTIWTSLTLGQYLFLFFAGWIASSAMILPGISGSLILLLLGTYPTVINAISELNITVIFVVGLGVVIGLVTTSKLIQYLFQNYSSFTYATLIGLVFGSIIVIFPGFPTSIAYAALTLFTFITGFALAISLGRIS